MEQSNRGGGARAVRFTRKLTPAAHRARRVRDHPRYRTAVLCATLVILAIRGSRLAPDAATPLRGHDEFRPERPPRVARTAGKQRKKRTSAFTADESGTKTPIESEGNEIAVPIPTTRRDRRPRARARSRDREFRYWSLMVTRARGTNSTFRVRGRRVLPRQRHDILRRRSKFGQLLCRPTQRLLPRQPNSLSAGRFHRKSRVSVDNSRFNFVLQQRK